MRLGGLNLSFFVLDETAIPKFNSFNKHKSILLMVAGLSLCHVQFYPEWLLLKNTPGLEFDSYINRQALTPHERLRLRCMLDAVIAYFYGLGLDDVKWILKIDKNDPKGFWRVDDDKPNELRHTTLTIEAFKKLEDVGLDEFLNKQFYFDESIASKLGPRFLSWQKENPNRSDIKNSWKECENHAIEFLGEEEYDRFEKALEYRKKQLEKNKSKPKKTHNKEKQGKLNL